MAGHAGGRLKANQRDPLAVDIAESEAMLERTPEGRGGVGRDQPSEVKDALVTASYSPPDKDWMPGWVREHVDRKSPQTDVIKDALRHVSKTPDRQTLLEVQMVVNELGRDPSRAELLRDSIMEASQKLFGKRG